MQYFAVGSKNPVKVNAVQYAAEKYFGKDVQVHAYTTPSGVSQMPFSMEEVRIGARTRATNARKQALLVLNQPVIGVGNEGGVGMIDGEWYLLGTSFATDGKIHSFGGQTQVRLPKKFIEMMKGGMVELGLVIDQVTGETNTKQKGGAIAILTNQIIQREDLFRFSTLQALSPWVHNFE